MKRLLSLVVLLLATGCSPPPAQQLDLVAGQRRTVELREGDSISVSPAAACEIHRLSSQLAVITPRTRGPATLTITGPNSDRVIPLSIDGPRAPAPSRPAAAPEASSPEEVPPFPKLLGTAAQENGQQALFSGKTAREGELVGPFRLDQVAEDGVRLSWRGRRFYLPLNGAVREELELQRGGNLEPRE